MGKIKHIQKKIDEIKQYFISFERDFSVKNKDVYKINLGFPVSWKCGLSENIEYKELETLPNLKIVYIKNLNPEITIDDLFEFVRHIIKINKEREQQQELLESKLNNIANDFFPSIEKSENKKNTPTKKNPKKENGAVDKNKSNQLTEKTKTNSKENPLEKNLAPSPKVIEGNEKSNTKTVTTSRPQIQPAPQKQNK